jgi:ABC-type branched-subunit amino acid transport system substrate-binding protein
MVIADGEGVCKPLPPRRPKRQRRAQGGKPLRKFFMGLVAVALLAGAGCASSGSDATDSSSGGSSKTSSPSGEAARAPGVTETEIKVGINYVDLEPVRKAGIKTDQGDFEGSYRALMDDINAKGGIHGRKIVPIFAPINPLGAQSSDEACLKQTEDDHVFVSIGFFNQDTVLCLVETHNTAVIGGSMNDERLRRAKAPWYTAEPGSDLEVDAVKKLASEGDLKGKVAVATAGASKDLLNTKVLPALKKAGITPVAVAIDETPTDVAPDLAAARARVKTYAEKFKSAGATTLLFVGGYGATWMQGADAIDYRPKLLFSTVNEIVAYANSNADKLDPAVLKGSLAAGVYGPYTEIVKLPRMKACVAIIEKAGIKQNPVVEGKYEGAKTWISARNSCDNVTVLKAILQKAGKDLNYASFRQAGDSLGTLAMPSAPEPYHYGAPPHADGDVPVFLFPFDPAAKTYLYPKKD